MHFLLIMKYSWMCCCEYELIITSCKMSGILNIGRTKAIVFVTVSLFYILACEKC